jgi:hypothetical protein
MAEPPRSVAIFHAPAARAAAADVRATLADAGIAVSAVSTFAACVGRAQPAGDGDTAVIIVDAEALGDPTFIDVADALSHVRPLFVMMDDPALPLGHSGDALDLRVWRRDGADGQRRLAAIAAWAKGAEAARRWVAAKPYVVTYEASRSEQTQRRAVLAMAEPTIAACVGALSPLYALLGFLASFTIVRLGRQERMETGDLGTLLDLTLAATGATFAVFIAVAMTLERAVLLTDRTQVFARVRPGQIRCGFALRMGLLAALGVMESARIVLATQYGPAEHAGEAVRRLKETGAFDALGVSPVADAATAFLLITTLGAAALVALVFVWRAPRRALAWFARSRVFSTKA